MSKAMINHINKSIAKRIKDIMLYENNLGKAERELKWVNKNLGDVLGSG